MPRQAKRDSDSDIPVITLLSDFGLSDVYVGVLHGVLAERCPQARVIDISHEIPPGDVLAGALALADALAFMPVGVHVAVIDPGVGSERRAVAVRCGDGRALVGPDNGLLGLAAAQSGGAVDAVEISDSPWKLDRVSATFHGRDVFAPVAAAIAGGRPLLAAGDPLEVSDLVSLELPDPEISLGALVATVTGVDRFGNLSLMASTVDARRSGLEPGGIVSVEAPGRRMIARFGRTFSDVGVGRLLLHEDSNGRLALAINGASAAHVLGVDSRTQLRLSR